MFGKDELPILGILRDISIDHVQPLVEIFTRCGIRYAEITMNTDGVNHLIKEMINMAGDRITIGAGTVLNKENLNDALEAGAKFIVTPALIDDVMNACLQNKIPFFPGALTPTEINIAWNAGATMVKLFPAGLFGPGYIKAIKAPLNNVKIMAVGGVNEKTISNYFRHGADAVAFGAGILLSEWLENKKYDKIEDRITKLINAFKAKDSNNLTKEV
mgnify:CR=1 FL=1